MLTLFSTPKPFSGLSGRIQENAIRSWKLLSPENEILLLGNDENIESAAGRLGVKRVPDIRVNEYGTPLLDDVFLRAEQVSQNPYLCYVNTDIILMPDFMGAVQGVIDELSTGFLGIGPRWDIDIEETIDYTDPDWVRRLDERVRTQGRLHGPRGIDFFLFPKGFWERIPPFAVGRTTWDNWLIFNAMLRGNIVVELNVPRSVVHQNHDYSHIRNGGGLWKGVESEKNREMGGNPIFKFGCDDAGHEWSRGRFRERPMSRRRLETRLILLSARFPLLRKIFTAFRLLLRPSKLFRKIFPDYGKTRK